jgi:hypothetical protein
MKIKALMMGLGLSLLVLGFARAPKVSAAGNPGMMGTWVIADRGPGAWAGGSLFANGAINGGGEFAFPVAQGVEEVAKIQPVGWSFTDASHTAVMLDFTITGVRGPVFPIGVAIADSLVVPVNGPGAPVLLFPPDTYAKVMMVH